MRFLMAAVILSLLMGLGPESHVWAGAELIDVRPGVFLEINDGTLRPNWQNKLDQAKDAETKKRLLTSFDPKHYASYFNLGSILTLLAEDSSKDLGAIRPQTDPDGENLPSIQRVKAFFGSGRLVIAYSRNTDYGLSYNFLVTLDRLYDREELKTRLGSAVIRVRIDDWLTEADHWETMGLSGIVSEISIFPALSLSLEARQKFDSQVLSALRGGRKADIEVVFTNGEKMSANFDLSGLDTALTLLAQKNDETDRTMEREVEALKKQLEALE